MLPLVMTTHWVHEIDPRHAAEPLRAQAVEAFRAVEPVVVLDIDNAKERLAAT